MQRATTTTRTTTAPTTIKAIHGASASAAATAAAAAALGPLTSACTPGALPRRALGPVRRSRANGFGAAGRSVELDLDIDASQLGGRRSTPVRPGVGRSMSNFARCAAATAMLTVGLGLAGVGAHAEPFARFPCPPNTPRGMEEYCDNPQPLPPPFAPAAPAPHATAPGQPHDSTPTPDGDAPGGASDGGAPGGG